jgi:hypothetical protein
MLIITFSWGFQLGSYIYIITTSTPHHQFSAMEKMPALNSVHIRCIAVPLGVYDPFAATEENVNSY